MYFETKSFKSFIKQNTFHTNKLLKSIVSENVYWKLPWRFQLKFISLCIAFLKFHRKALAIKLNRYLNRWWQKRIFKFSFNHTKVSIKALSARNEVCYFIINFLHTFYFMIMTWNYAAIKIQNALKIAFLTVS